MSDIVEFYRGRSVFITGATGFLGKVLVEKLLRSCPDIKAVYLLIRPKKGQDAVSRLQDFSQQIVSGGGGGGLRHYAILIILRGDFFSLCVRSPLPDIHVLQSKKK